MQRVGYYGIKYQEKNKKNPFQAENPGLVFNI